MFCQKKDGYLLPVSLMVKILPYLDWGINFIGFIKDFDEKFAIPGHLVDSHYIIYNAYDCLILGVTASM